MNGRELFDGLDDGLPLALLPVRLVTRFHRPDEHSPPTQLHLRIYPDVIHADAHDPALTEHEEQLGRAYWEHVAGGDEAVIADARARLAAQLDPYRALWVASATAGGAKPARSTGPRPTIARLLPARWLAIGYVNREEVDRWWSLPVTADLPMAPNLTALAEGDGVRAFLRKQGLQWMVDFEQAVQVGMGMKIPLDNVTATTGFEELIVVGVGDRDDDSATLAALMAAHRYTEGLDFVPQGAPTNNTDSVASAVTTDAPDLGALFEAEGGNPLPRGRPALTDPALLYRMRAANAASIALGLTAVNALDRAPNAGLMEGADAHAMNTALWWATVEYLLSSPLAHDGAPVLTRTQLNWLRKWFRDYVRGGAALPVMRIGTQPYGLLPVGAMPFGAGFWTPASSREWLEKTVADLFDTWVASREDAPALSPVPGGVRPSKVAGEEAVTVASVLGAVPHPMRFRLRDALDEFASRRDGWEDRLDGFEVLLDRVDVSYRTLAKNHYLNLEAEIRGNGGVSAQLSAVRQLRTEYQAEWTGNESQSPFRELNGHITKYLEPLLEAHDDRAKLRHLVSGLPTDAALPDSTDPRLWYVLYEPPGDEDAPALRLVEEDTAGLADALRRLADPPPGPPITIPASVPIPLMHRLVRRAFETPPADFVADLRAACRSLATIADRGADDLERLTAETLGLLTHRLDAWHASLAAERLALKRTPKAKQGVQVGGYGWVVNLAPDPTGEADTQGFIHAPSLAHAATAAVLRSAWSAFSTDASAAAFAVDLSSDRVRRAEWILGGVRNGQSLEELLGGRFERRLHDAALDTYIDVIRSAVLTAQGSRRPPSAIVDGLALAEAYADLGAPPDAVRTAVDAVIAGDDRRALETLLRQTAVDLDAASDALTAQAVHSVLTGDLAEAAAASAAMGSGDSGVPELRYAHVRRESDLVMHRVTALFGDDTPAAPSLLGTIEPALCAWVDRLLAGIGTATCRAGATTFPLSELKLTAYQLLALAGSGRLERLVAGYARRFKGQSDVAVELPAELDALVPLRRAIGRARPLGRHDLARDQIEPVPDLAELDVRRGQVITALTTLAQQKVNDVLLSSRLADLLTVDDAATLAALEADDAQERGRLLLSVTTRAAETANALGKGVEPADLAERLAAVSRIPITVLPRFTAGDPAGLRRAFTNGDARAGSPLAIPGWLLQVGRVHAAAGLLHEGLGLIELVTGAARAAYGLAQLPDEAGEPWAAIGKPRGGRTCVVTVTDWRKPLGDTGISGLLFDAWTEPVPRRDVMTGVAVHFDSPSARPPQAVLLMTSPAFNVDEIVGILRDTLEMARCRAIGTETLADLGQYLPGLFLPEGYAVEGESAGADSVASSLREHRVEVSG